MTQDEMMALIRDGVRSEGGTWAEMGAGSGNFTWALAELLGPTGTLYALDRDPQAIQQLHERLRSTPPAATVHPLLADFTEPLALLPLDGVLLANSLHFQRDHAAVLRHLAALVRPGGSLLLVEYDLAHSLPWVPFPIPWERLPALLRGAGLAEPTRIGTRRSPTTGIVMYAAIIQQTG